MKTGIISLLIMLTAALSLGADSDPSRELMSMDMKAEGAAEKARQLLDAGANPDYYARGGDRPVFHAVKSGNREIVKMLLDRRVALNISFDDATGSPLDSAVAAGDPEIVRMLIKAKADVNYKMRGAVTALHTACLQSESSAADEIITVLIDSGADINAVTHFGVTPLMNAVEADNGGAVKILLERGADPRIKNIKGKTAKDLAVSGKKKAEIIKMLKAWKKKGK